MVRLGKWMEQKTFFRDNLRGYRGIQWTQGRRDNFYRLCWFGRVTFPARGTATNIGGAAIFKKSNAGSNVASTRACSYWAPALGAHGIDNVVGAFFLMGRKGAGVAPPTAAIASVLNASTIRVQPASGYTAATFYGFLFVWGASAFQY
jgi:hypothetical protein